MSSVNHIAQRSCGAVIICFILFSCNSNKLNSYQELRNSVNRIRIVDTHEHFAPESDRSGLKIDFFTLAIGYLQADMISSGMTDSELAFMLDDKNLPAERWKIFDSYWGNVRNTGYGKCFSYTIRDLFGIDSVNERSFTAIDRKMKDSMADTEWYKHVLKDVSMIDVSIVDPLGKNAENVENYPAGFFVRVRRFDNFVQVNRTTIRDLGEKYGLEINSLDTYLKALDMAFDKAVNDDGIIGIKSGLAYSRIMYFEDTPREKAEALFIKYIHNQALSKEEKKALDDFMMHQVVERAEEYNLPVQIHTGILSRNFNNSNPIENTNAAHLSNLFLKYRRAKFVIFHGSYPYMAELSYLAKHYPNVYIDMCWMYIISPPASKIYLKEWLNTVPSNKIMGFGGDCSVEWAAGHSKMAREIITEVLINMINEGSLSETEAIEIAERLLRKNAIDLYKLENMNGNWISKR
jgi:glucuronate isomerase